MAQSGPVIPSDCDSQHLGVSHSSAPGRVGGGGGGGAGTFPGTSDGQPVVESESEPATRISTA